MAFPQWLVARQAPAEAGAESVAPLTAPLELGAPVSTRRQPLWKRMWRLATALTGGILVALAFPPFGQIWAMPIGLAGLMVAVHGVRGRVGFGLGVGFGAGFLLLLLNWLTVIGVDAWVVVSLIEALFYGLVGMSWAWLQRFAWWPLGAAATWVGAEHLRSTLPFGGLPWGKLAFGLVDVPFDRYGRVGGTALVSFLSVLVVALLLAAWWTRHRWPWRAILAVVAVAVAFGSVALPVGAASAAGSVQVAVVQGNVQQVGLQSFEHRMQVLRNHTTATERLAVQVAAGRRAAPAFVVWPESSTDIDPFHNAVVAAEVEQAVSAVGVPVLVGAVLDGPGQTHVRNVGIVWSPTTGPGQEYVKQHLVPFGEYLPFRDVLTRIVHRFQLIPRDFVPGHRPGNLTIAGTPVGDIICFEVAYDDISRAVVDGGARLLVVQTNNADYADTGQLAQQFAISRYRAIEAGRSVAIASTDGISGIVTPTGHVVGQTAARTQAVLDGKVQLASGTTWGIRVGYWVEIGLSLLGVVAALLAFVLTRRRTASDAA